MHTLRFFVLCSDIPASPCASSCCRASYERGEYPESVAALEQAVQDVGADTNMGGDAQLWLGLAYQVGGWVGGLCGTVDERVVSSPHCSLDRAPNSQYNSLARPGAQTGTVANSMTRSAEPTITYPTAPDGRDACS